METTQRRIMAVLAPPSGFVAGKAALALQCVQDVANKMQFVVDVWGWSQPQLQPRENETPATVPVTMTQVTAPAPPNTPGQWESTIVYTVKGPHDMRAYNSDGYITQDV